MRYLIYLGRFGKVSHSKQTQKMSPKDALIKDKALPKLLSKNKIYLGWFGKVSHSKHTGNQMKSTPVTKDSMLVTQNSRLS